MCILLEFVYENIITMHGPINIKKKNNKYYEFFAHNIRIGVFLSKSQHSLDLMLFIQADDMFRPLF
jgi:hypothetical protein